MKLCHLQRCGWTVIQSEVNQKGKNKYRILMHVLIHGI